VGVVSILLSMSGNLHNHILNTDGFNLANSTLQMPN